MQIVYPETKRTGTGNDRSRETDESSTGKLNQIVDSEISVEHVFESDRRIQQRNCKTISCGDTKIDYQPQGR